MSRRQIPRPERAVTQGLPYIYGIPDPGTVVSRVIESRSRAVSLILAAAILVGGVVASQSASARHQVAPRDNGVRKHVSDKFVDGCIGYCKHPTNAAKVFRWGVEEWRREFEERETHEAEGKWRSRPVAALEQRDGMLTIHAGSHDSLVTVTARDQAAVHGRWEARVRAVEETSGGTPFAFTWGLTPADHRACDAEGIVLSSYTPGDDRVTGEIRKAPNNEFRFSRKLDLRSRAWHAYAIEVTPHHISWFVDTRVIRTERRSPALAGVKLRPQFQIVGQAGQRMRSSRMQMDWVRYYDLDPPSAKSVKAKRMTRGVFEPGC